jgi:hypothetical protein
MLRIYFYSTFIDAISNSDYSVWNNWMILSELERLGKGAAIVWALSLLLPGISRKDT